jgi:hypothetical protein
VHGLVELANSSAQATGLKIAIEFFEENATGWLASHDAFKPLFNELFFDPVDGFYVHIQHTPAESGNTGRFRPSACLFY